MAVERPAPYARRESTISAINTKHNQKICIFILPKACIFQLKVAMRVDMLKKYL
jgi:hypothetical protein